MQKYSLAALILAFSTSCLLAGPEAIATSNETKNTVVAPAMTEEFSWTGFYVGGRVGYGWHDGDIDSVLLPRNFTIVPGELDNSSEGVIGGGELGYNRQFGKFVLGIETDFSWSDINGDSDPQTHFREVMAFTLHEPLSHEINWFGTVRGRIGFAVCPRLLIYGTGGFAYGEVEQHAGCVALPIVSYVTSRTDTETGWTAGGGVEYALSRHWSVKAEYLYSDLGDNSMTAFPKPAFPPYRIRYDWDNTLHTVSVGVNFKF